MATDPSGGGTVPVPPGSKRGVQGVGESPKSFQQQAGSHRPYESPQPKIHGARHGSRRPTPDKVVPNRTSRPGD